MMAGLKNYDFQEKKAYLKLAIVVLKLICHYMSIMRFGLGVNIMLMIMIFIITIIIILSARIASR